jgi:hypothetical protein
LILVLSSLLFPPRRFIILEFKLRKQKHKINGPIKTVVVVVMENRSFDHVLGWLKVTRPDIDGLTGEDAVVANTLFAKHMPKRLPVFPCFGCRRWLPGEIGTHQQR